MANNKGRRRRFGAVRQLPSKKWQARYPGPDGQLLTADKTFATKTAAEEWLTDTESEMRRGDWIDPRGDLVFGTFAIAWIKERPNLRPRTRELYSILLRLHLMPTFGMAAIPTIKEADVRRWRATRLEGGVGLSTTAKAYRLMRAIMNTAVDDGLIRRNPCRIKGGGDEKAPERPILTLEQVFTLADGVGPRYRALVLLAAFGSLRWGELVALRRDHVDLDAGAIRIDVSAIEMSNGKRITGPPKSAAGKRTVTIPAPILLDLRRQVEWFAEKEEDGLLFVGPKGAALRRCNFTRVWRRGTHHLGVTDLHFHDLRHTGNVLAAETGATLRELMDRMGQSTSRAALIYQHARAGRDQAIADSIAKRIKKSRPQDHPQSGTDLAREA
ncbi:hypothetical protein B4N89_14130 [Embleya scabrispora]|uniref:Site-specific integrase n=1 Tax=Embleya scabrispora TaxID=159449 RepID=A0A1T3NYW3_9ACTN|nr:site-specific integrase [Embleya scabrispora]OPC81925.1 hypothetical protein B4N89_14130 [Embleya scabrispora]